MQCEEETDDWERTGGERRQNVYARWEGGGPRVGPGQRDLNRGGGIRNGRLRSQPGKRVDDWDGITGVPREAGSNLEGSSQHKQPGPSYLKN